MPTDKVFDGFWKTRVLSFSIIAIFQKDDIFAFSFCVPLMQPFRSKSGFYYCKIQQFNDTPPKTNMSPKKGLFHQEIHLPTNH